MSASAPLAVRVWGDLACFTRPELKVERVSYEVMTPSAARGILEAIFWKPEIAWRILRLVRPSPHPALLRSSQRGRPGGLASHGIDLDEQRPPRELPGRRASGPAPHPGLAGRRLPDRRPDGPQESGSGRNRQVCGPVSAAPAKGPVLRPPLSWLPGVPGLFRGG